MYEIWADDLLIYSDITPLESVKVIEPKLTLADSAAGSLEMTIPPTNIGYDVIKRMTTDIIVRCDYEEIWRGRVLTDDYDFWKRRKLVCEGELAFLNDTTQPPHQYLSTETTIETFITSLLEIHNNKVADNRKFEVGQITVHDGDQQDDSDAIYRYTNYETTLECINDKLVSRLGGHIRVRHQNGHRYLDYLDDDGIGSNSQIIRFGVNLMDFVKSFDMSELCTVLVPRGARLDEEEIEGLEAYLTVKTLPEETETNPDTGDTEVWHQNQSLYVMNPTAISTYGWIEAVVDWDNVTEDITLYHKAVKYLQDEQYDKMTLEIKAVDLRYASDSYDRIKMLDKLRCISTQHGMDHTFPVTKMEIRLDKPDDSIYTLGTDVPLSLTQANSKINQETMDRIDNLPSKSNILKAAQANAYQIINGVEGSYVHFVTDEDGAIIRIEVTDEPTLEMSLNRWIFNEGGLGHLTRPDTQTDWDDIGSMNVAMTYDGQIVADMITTGVLKAYNNRFSIDTETGHIVMLDAILGPWTLNYGGNGLSDGGDAWVGPSKIACGKHGGTLIEMNGTTSGHDGHLSVEVNDFADWVRVYYSYIERSDGKFAKFESGSDERIKEDINDLSFEEALKIINNTELLSFRYKKDEDKIKHYGVTAQRMEKECEHLGIDNPFVKKLNENLKTVDYDQFVAPLMKVVQCQQKEIEQLKQSLQNEQ